VPTGVDCPLTGEAGVGAPGVASLPSPPTDRVSEVARLVTDAGSLDATVMLGVAFVVASLAVGGWWWIRYRYRPRAAVLRAKLAKPDSVTVLTHPNPDPDAMASAVGVARIAEAAGTPATVQYPGEIRHPENRAFHTVLGFEMDPIESAADLTADEVVLVDHSEPRGFDGADAVRPYAVVDHHPGDDTIGAFSDVRTEYGACATILAEYFQSLDATVADEDTPPEEDVDGLALPTDLATGLAVGILTDTDKLTRGCGLPDFAAMEYLYPAVDDALLDRIANPQVDHEVLEARAKAILQREQRLPYVVSDVGSVDNLDAIPGAADELLTLEGVTTALVLGERDGDLYFSGRSRDDRVHVGRALQRAVEDIPGAEAGGHARMGGGTVPAAALEEVTATDDLLQPTNVLSRADLHEHLFDAMAGKV
jgi:nanoRNase/pAp phosphatase (c-di-AMP/oligoRNAs hydrolase)